MRFTKPFFSILLMLPCNSSSLTNILRSISAISFCNWSLPFAVSVVCIFCICVNRSLAAFTSFSASVSVVPNKVVPSALFSSVKEFCNLLNSKLDKSPLPCLILSCTALIALSASFISLIFTLLPVNWLKSASALFAATSLSITTNSASASSLFAPCTIISCRAIRSFSEYSLLFASNKIFRFAVVISSSFNPAKKLGYCARKSAIKLLRI